MLNSLLLPGLQIQVGRGTGRSLANAREMRAALPFSPLTAAFTEGPLLCFHLSPCPVFPPLHPPTSVKLSQSNSASPFLQSFHKSLPIFQLPRLSLSAPVTYQYSAAALGQDGLEFMLILLPDPSAHLVTDLTAVSFSLLV